MPLLTKVGSFVKPGAAAAQAITGLGFVPKAIIFWTAASGQNSGIWSPVYDAVLGLTAGPTNSFSCSAGSNDNVATSNTTRRIAAKAITMSYSEFVTDEADLVSFDADGFTLNWTTAGDTYGTNVAINYLALGGSDLTGAKVVQWTTPTAVGNKAVIGAGFSPDLVLHASAFGSTVLPASSAVATFTFGVMNRHGQQWGNAFHSADAVSPSDTARYQQSDACLMLSNPAASGVFYQAHFASVDADGFTTHFSSTTATAEPVISLCLKGVSSKVGAFTKTTAAAPAAQGVTTGFQPKAVLLSMFAEPATAGPLAGAWWQLGAADGVSQRVASLYDQDAANPTVTKAVFDSASVLRTGFGTPTTETVVGTLTALDPAGFALSFNPNQNSAQEILYLALGDAGVNTYPALVG